LFPGELLTVGTVTFRAVYGDWTDGDDVLSEVRELAGETAKLSLEETTLHADEETKRNEITGLPHALVKNAGDQIST
jgi:hypothetical protein